MKEIVSVSLGAKSEDYELTVDFRGQRFHIQRFGADGSVAQARELLQTWDARADAIGLGMVKDHYTVGTHHFVEPETAALLSVVQRTPVTTGARLRTLLSEWAVRHVQSELGHYFDNARMLFLSGMTNWRLAHTLSEYTQNLAFADPAIQLGIPRLLPSLRALERYALLAGRAEQRVPGALLSSVQSLREQRTRRFIHQALAHATMVVSPFHHLERYAQGALRRKVVLTSCVSDKRLELLRHEDTDAAIDLSVQAFPHVVGLNVLEAVMLASLDGRPEEAVDDELLEMLSEAGVAPRVLYPSGKPRRVNRFSFVIHPLSQEYFKVVKPVEVISRVAPRGFMRSVEKLFAHAPPMMWSHITGIESPTGVEAEGWLLTVGGTPQELLSHSPEFTYRRLLAAAKMSRRLGAQIMGLGAFTKIVGDAGVTVARRAELPITTGNSYSASAALWALADAVRRMGLIPLDVSGRIEGKAMVIGATGSIGSVCARLLAQAVEELHLVSPEMAKLLALKEAIEHDTPGAKIHVWAHADERLGEMDAIVTATSGAGKRVLDIMKVKPGCVITDIARPLDLPPSEVQKRPDVLVIESGEILVPGDAKLGKIGLPPHVAYACMAETIVLALEGRFESFTVGRNIEWPKVKEIYKLGLKHGMKLAAISGANGVYTDEDIARVRERAVEALASKAPPRVEPERAITPESPGGARA